jgi:hypothetical protein
MLTPYVVGLDTETHLIAAGLQAPPLVVLSFCTVAENGAGLLLRDDALAYAHNVLAAPHATVVGQNVAFDMAVLVEEDPTLFPRIFEAYAEGRIRCTRVREMLLHNATEGLSDDGAGPKVSFSLGDIVRRRFGVDLSADKSGPDAWRLRYAELDGVPLAEWPDEARRYAGDDAVWALRVFQDQEKDRFAGEVDLLADEQGQTAAAFCLHLMQAWGVLTDEAAVLALEARLTETVEAADEKLRQSGILKGKSTKRRDTGIIEVEWSKNTARIKDLIEEGFAARGMSAPRTDPSHRFPEGQIKMDEETLREAGHPDLLVLADSMGDAKLLGTYVQALKGRIKKGNTNEYEQRGLHIPGRGWLLNSSPNPLVATGRTSWSKPNLQNPPRKGGVRECIVPRPGYWYLSVDYSFIELCTWAQYCIDTPNIGHSKLAEAIRAGLDPHVDMGVEALRVEQEERVLEWTANGHTHRTTNRDVTYAILNAARKAGAPWAKDARQLAKALNFGLPGGLGAATFCAFAKATYGVHVEEADAMRLKPAWLQKWTEAQPFFNHVSAMQGFGGQTFTVTLPRSGFVRAGCRFTSGCNTTFQGPAARGAKEAMFLLARACYDPTAKDAALYGSRPVLFLHDEFILEVPAHRERAHAASLRVQELMLQGMRRFVPDVPVKAEPTLMERWYKEAEPVYGADGVLELWRPNL